MAVINTKYLSFGIYQDVSTLLSRFLGKMIIKNVKEVELVNQANGRVSYLSRGEIEDALLTIRKVGTAVYFKYLDDEGRDSVCS